MWSFFQNSFFTQVFFYEALGENSFSPKIEKYSLRTISHYSQDVLFSVFLSQPPRLSTPDHPSLVRCLSPTCSPPQRIQASFALSPSSPSFSLGCQDHMFCHQDSPRFSVSFLNFYKTIFTHLCSTTF